MTWSELDWDALDRLRNGFLNGVRPGEAYWKTPSDLGSYDLTYGERIGWKWDAVLAELAGRRWTPQVRTLLDWGCGSGIAGRRVLRYLGASRPDTLLLWDHSALASDFAAAAAEREFPGLRAAQVTAGFFASDEPIDLLVVSHVQNELLPEALEALHRLLDRVRAVIWVEPGTREISRRLGALRDHLAGPFRIVAPCTRSGACPVLTTGNERHWCHHFARPPSAIFADPEWVRFGQRAGIDLRSLPYCFLAADRSPLKGGEPLPPSRLDDSSQPADSSDPAGAPSPAILTRVIGRPEHFKAHARVLACDETGLAELTLAKRDDPVLYKELDRTKAPLVYRWRREGLRILGSEP
jgi:hypothetical protein